MLRHVGSPAIDGIIREKHIATDYTTSGALPISISSPRKGGMAYLGTWVEME